jgi:hypothetical protein
MSIRLFVLRSEYRILGHLDCQFLWREEGLFMESFDSGNEDVLIL